MSDEDLDPAAERVTAAIADAIKAGELGDDTSGIPNQFVLVATYYDSDGVQRTAYLVNNGSYTHEVLGLLALARIKWTEQIRQTMDDGED